MLTNKGSVYDLAATYIKLHVRRKVTEAEHKDIVSKLSYVLDMGYTFKECDYAIKANIGCKFKILDIQKNTGSYSNLLKQNQMYFHKELRVQPEPSVTDIDYNTGTMVSTKPEYFVEIAASYTMEDLMNYLMSFGYVDSTQWQYSRLHNMLKHYIKKYSLDIVLFMFEAIADNLEEKYFDFNKFDNYYPNAVRYMNNIMDNCKANGGDVICQKNRNVILER